MRWNDGKSRFWAKVRKSNGCWEWVGGLAAQTGYGDFYDGKRWSTHRYSWTIHTGAIPSGLCVLHSCDNRRCVRPNHLFLGTKRQNSQDMVMKGRHRVEPKKGQDHGEAKLTEAQVLRIRAIYKRGNGITLAAKYGVSPSLISMIVLRKAWKHL